MEILGLQSMETRCLKPSRPSSLKLPTTPPFGPVGRAPGSIWNWNFGGHSPTRSRRGRWNWLGAGGRRDCLYSAAKETHKREVDRRRGSTRRPSGSSHSVVPGVDWVAEEAQCSSKYTCIYMFMGGHPPVPDNGARSCDGDTIERTADGEGARIRSGELFPRVGAPGPPVA